MNLTLSTKYTFLMVFILILASCGDDDENDQQMEPEEEAEVTIEGNYTGEYSSTTENASFDNIPLSVILERGSSENTFEGQVFLGSFFMPCCGNNPDNGTIRMTIVDEAVTEFEWDIEVTGCNGTFSGEGTIDIERKMDLTFTGGDCSGEQEGILTLLKFN